jgi:hypothetical protein
MRPSYSAVFNNFEVILVKGFLKFSLIAFLFALLTAPVFAKTYSVTIPQAVTVGSTQIPAGSYKLSWEGNGPVVKVTMTRYKTAPIVLDAKILGQKSGLDDPGVVTGAAGGATILREIQLKSATLVFTGAQ